MPRSIVTDAGGCRLAHRQGCACRRERRRRYGWHKKIGGRLGRDPPICRQQILLHQNYRLIVTELLRLP